MDKTLDNYDKIKQLDKSNLRGSISELHLQVEHAYSDISKLKIETKYQNVKNIIISGMGGSALGADIINSVYKDKINIPLQIINSYTLPKSATKNSLIILSSYSGSTEETIECAKQALKYKSKILAITSGGKLENFCLKNKIPYYKIYPKHNPSNQPRMALGYSVAGQLGLLAKCKIININKTEINKIIGLLEKLNRIWGPEMPTENNFAKETAIKFKNKIPIIIASEFLEGNAHAFRNQLNENAKTFANHFLIPELNHHLMEGLGFPKSNTKNLHFIFLNSNLYNSRNKKRYKITEQVVKKNKVNFEEYKLKSKTKLEQSFEILLLGSYIGFYLSMLNNINPSPIPWVDYFKKQL